MTFTHVVTFKWRDSDRADVDGSAIADALQAVVARLDGVHSYLCGPDAGVTPGAYDFAVVGTFEDREHFITYRDHPDHQQIINDMIQPHLESRTVVQLQQ